MLRLSRTTCVAIWALSLSAACAAEVPGEAQFLARNRCKIDGILNKIRATPFDYKDESWRFLILFPANDTGAYAQCAFGDRDVTILCEVASPQSQATGRRARLPALAALGYDIEASKGNYAREFRADAENAPPLPDFMLRSLYEAFLDDPATPLGFQAPLVKVWPSDGCQPTS